MKQFLGLLLIVAVGNVAGFFSPGLRVRFDIGLIPGYSFFYDIPRTMADAKEEGWKYSRRPPGPLPELKLYCMSDKMLCTMYDDTGYVAGLQVAIPKQEFTDNVFSWTQRGFTSWNTSVDGQCVQFWTLQQFFVSEEFLQKSKEERIAERDSTRTLQAGAVWLMGTDKQLLKVSKIEEDIQQSIFTKQACIPLMGQHYYYNMSKTTECTADQIYPWFPLTKDGELIATGFMTFGKLPIKDGARDWFERPETSVVKLIVPEAPECLYDLTDSAGTLTMHIYYIDAPWTVFCV